MKPFTCSFYGLGLIGGSIARALREARPDARILACDIQESALLQAKEEGIADEIFLQLDATSSLLLRRRLYLSLRAGVP